MIKVAICDDDISYSEAIKEIILNYDEIKEEVVFYEYPSGEELLDAIWQQHDLLFLDIQMSGLDGNQTGKLFRDYNKDAILVFCTNFQSPIPESFKALPFRYILKDLHNEMLRDEMHDILEETISKTNDRYLNVTSDGKVSRIRLKSILYISVIKRGAQIHVYPKRERQNIYCKEVLKELYDILKGEGFEYAHNSYIVNMANIIQLNKSSLLMRDKITLNISRSKKAQFDKSFTEFLHKGYKRR